MVRCDWIKPGATVKALLSFKGPGVGTPGLLSTRNCYLISHTVLCGMSIAYEPAGSPAGVATVTQANGSVPVIPLYLPVPPVMIWVPQSIFGCALSRSALNLSPLRRRSTGGFQLLHLVSDVGRSLSRRRRGSRLGRNCWRWASCLGRSRWMQATKRELGTPLRQDRGQPKSCQRGCSSASAWALFLEEV